MNMVLSKQHKLYQRLILLTVTLFAGVMALQKVYDYDVWWHLRSGQWLVENRAILRNDPFSFSTSGADWNFVYWLSDPLFYLLSAWTGIEGLQLFCAVVVAGAVLALLLFLVRQQVPVSLAAPLLVWVVALARFRFILRPLVFKFAGVVFLFWFFFAKPAGRFRYPLFFVVVLVWNGLYPAAFLAQFFAGFLLLEKLVEYIGKSPRYAGGDLRDATILLGLASLALLVNPGGVELYRYVYGGLFSDYAAGITLVEEQKSLAWSEHPGFAALVILAGITFWLGRKSFRLMTFLVFAAFVALAWGSVRFLGLSSFAMAGVIGVNLAHYPWPAWLSWQEMRGWWPRILVLAALCAGCFLVWQGTFQKTRGYEFGLGVKRNRFPDAAVQLLRDAGYSGNIYNSWKFGGFLQWHLPQAKTFIDGRCLPAQLTLYERFKTIELHEFSRYLDEHQVRVALIDRKELRDVGYFSGIPGFRQIHADDVSILFARSDLFPELSSSSPGAYRYLRPGGYEFEYLAPLAASSEAPLVEQELLESIKRAPDSFFENFLLAYFYEARGDARAPAQYLLAARKNPGFAVTHFNVGGRGAQAALRSGQWQLAVDLATLALEYRKTGELYFFLGAAQQQLGQQAAAEQAYRASLAMTENNRVRNNLGFLLLEMNRPDAARETFAKGLEGRTGKDLEQSLYGLTLALIRLRDGNAATALRGRLAAEFPESEYLNRLPVTKP